MSEVPLYHGGCAGFRAAQLQIADAGRASPPVIELRYYIQGAGER